MTLTSNVLKKEIQSLFRLDLNSMKRLWCNADTEMILFNHGKSSFENVCFSIYALSMYALSIYAVSAPGI